MRNCILCNEPTNGAIGAAGMYWRNLCQTCKDSEDAALRLRINAESQGLKFVMDKLFGLGEQQTEVETLSKEEKMEQFL